MFRMYSMVLILLLSGVANAVEIQSSGTINRLLNYEGHNGHLIVLSDMSPTSGSCPRNDYYILPLTHKYIDQNYALLLSAVMAGKPVSVTVDSGDCFENIPRIKHLLIDN